ncbi:MAG: DNA translocase FtsK 4TM domain-containing protein, partial [Planctomycetota bacterium]
MLEERDIRVDIGALALLVLAICLGLSLVTYSPADPPVEMVYPFNQLYQQDVLCYPCSEVTTNACGRLGSLASSFMYDAFGVGSYYVTISLAIFAASLLMRRDLDSPVLRTAGWFASLLGLTTLVNMLLPWLSPGTVLGGGGLMGALGAGFLRYHFADVGGFILATSCLIGGILLCTDYGLVHLGLVIGSLTITGFAGARSVVGRRDSAALAQDDIEEYEYDEEDQEDEEFNVRVGGRTIRLVSDDEDEQEARQSQTHLGLRSHHPSDRS